MATEIQINFEKLNENIIAYFQNNDESLLHVAKQHFSTFIDSNRQLRSVQNIEKLLALLKKRGLYGCREFATLKIFDKIIDDENYRALFDAHKSLDTSSPPQEPLHNIYAERRLHADRNKIPSDKRNEIFNLIASRITPGSFRRLARQLDFSEGEIKDFEVQMMQDCATRTIVMLGLYEEKKNSLKRLLKVLEVINHSDLVQDINTILRR